MSDYPIAYDQSPPSTRSRLTVFFRFVLALPHFVWAIFYGIAVFIALIIAWVAVVFAGRYPADYYDFVAGYVRYYTRVCAYALLVVDRYPPFDGGEHPEYPVRVKIAPGQSRYSRPKAFFRLILGIPILILQAYVFQYWLFIVAIGIWFVAVVMGRTSAGLTEAMRFPMSYCVRSSAYLYLMTDRYPPVSEREPPHQPIGFPVSQ